MSFMVYFSEDDLFYIWLPLVGEKFSNICLPIIVLLNEDLVFSIICWFIENTTVIRAVKGFLVNPLNNKKNQRAYINYELLLVWLSAGNVSNSYPLVIIVILTKAKAHAKMQIVKCS